MRIYITNTKTSKKLFRVFSQNVHLVALFYLMLSLSACQSVVRFSSSARNASPSPTAALSSSNSKSRANSSEASQQRFDHSLANKSLANKSLANKSLTNKGNTSKSLPRTGTEWRLIESAERWLGTPYLYGSNTRSGTDCSGFVMRVYEENGIAVPRSTKDQFFYGRAVDMSELQVGDLVFFNTNGLGVSHVGIYAGGDTIIHASSKSGVVKQSFSDTYLAKTYIGARRLVQESSD